MKKLITILTIAIVLVGAVFAGTTGTATEGEGDAALKVNVTIAGVTPTFAIRTSATNVELETAGGPASVGEVNDDATMTDAAALKLAGGTAVTVSFDVIQVSDAKMFGKFYFSAAATSLFAQQGSVDDDDWADIDDSAKVFEIQTASATPAITVSETTHSVADGANAGFARLASTTTSNEATTKANITYLGVLKATSADPYKIGTFTCTWNGNVTAIPVDYVATVTLTVEAN